MKVVVAIDSFKGSLSSLEAGEAAAEGIRRAFPQACVVVRPLADGGEGTVEALTSGMGGQIRRIRVTGPLGETVECDYGILDDGQMEDGRKCRTAIIEMAGAAGITLVPLEKRNPLHTTTYGVGEVIRDAIGQGCRRFIIGIGGSATNDGGIGMLQALGFDFLDEKGKQVPFGAEGLKHLHQIKIGQALPELPECEFHVACDVKNVLCGAQGCSAVFGPQKGATPEMIQEMDQWMAWYAELAADTWMCGVQKEEKTVDSNYPGSGAAGGSGFALRTFLNAELEPGIEIVLREIGLEREISDADMVVTGEGRLDGQTVMGKAPIGVARLAKRHGKPVVAFAGCVEPEAAVCTEKGIDAYFSILRKVVPLEKAMETEIARRNMTDTVEQVFRLLRLR